MLSGGIPGTCDQVSARVYGDRRVSPVPADEEVEEKLTLVG